jgi:hypothetical protein
MMRDYPHALLTPNMRLKARLNDVAGWSSDPGSKRLCFQCITRAMECNKLAHRAGTQQYSLLLLTYIPFHYIAISGTRQVEKSNR